MMMIALTLTLNFFNENKAIKKMVQVTKRMRVKVLLLPNKLSKPIAPVIEAPTNENNLITLACSRLPLLLL